MERKRGRLVKFTVLCIGLVFLLLPTGCATGLLSLQTLDAAMEVGKPYITDGCREVTIAPSYTLDFSGTSLLHSGGIFLGGCGRMLGLRCGQVDYSGNPTCEALSKWREVPPLFGVGEIKLGGAAGDEGSGDGVVDHGTEDSGI